MADTRFSSRNDAVGRFNIADALNATRDAAIVPGGLPNVLETKIEPFEKGVQVGPETVDDDGLLDVGGLGAARA